MGEMSTVAEMVDQRLSRDGVLREALRRDVVNLRALARWLIATYDWDASEEAVLSALRRRTEDLGPDPLADARRVYSQAHLNLRSQVALVILVKDPRVEGQLAEVVDAVDYGMGETLRVIRSQRAIKLITDETNLDPVLDLLAEDLVDEVLRGVAEIEAIHPPASLRTPGMLALLTEALAYQEINILELVTGVTEHLVVVAEDDAMTTYQAMDDLIERCRIAGG